MKYFPINLKISQRRCTVVGGGRVAARKVASLLECHGLVSVISPDLTRELRELHAQNKIEWLARSYRTGDLTDSFLVIAATDNQAVQREVQREAEETGLLLNVADVPDLCNFILPASTSRGDLTLSVSTAGQSPALARKIRIELSRLYGPEYRILCEILGAMRPLVMALGQGHEENKKIFINLLHDEFPDWIENRNYARINKHVTSVLGKDLEQKAVSIVRGIINPGPETQTAQASGRDLP